MRWWCLVCLHAIGCAQLFGIEQTTSPPPQDGSIDGRPIDARKIDAPLDAPRVCAGGDARVSDPMTGACYMLFTGEKSRNDARTTCSGLGGGAMLASVQSNAESQLLIALIGQSSVFLGGSDELVEGSFKWEDGSAVVLTNWNTGEPNNGTGLLEEDCIVMHGMLAGKWDDRPCAPTSGTMVAGAYSFVCEQD